MKAPSGLPDYEVVSTGGAEKPVEARWKHVAQWTPTPTSGTTITVTSVTGLAAGVPIRFRTVAGGSTYFYAIIDSISGFVVTIKGPALSSPIVALWYGLPEMVIQVDFFVPGLYAATAQTVLKNIAATFCRWQFGAAALVHFKCNADAGGGSGTPVVNVKIGSNAVDTDGVIVVASTWTSAAAIDPTKYTVARNDDIEIVVSTLDSTQTDLTLSCAMVLH